MNFETYLNQAWNDHATQSATVAAAFPSGAQLVETNDQLVQLVGLITHVMGEHLAQWNNGIEILTGLKSHPKFIAATETEKALVRSIEIMKIGAGQIPALQKFVASDQIRIMAVASSALAERDASKAKDLLLQALTLARSGLERKDPANRALAVTGNNLACALEEKSKRTPSETELMILAAQTARQFWEIAGTWLEVSRAEYRLAMTYLQAQDLKRALQHAQICAQLCVANKASELDMFYCYEALATVEKVRQNTVGFSTALGQAKQHFAQLTPDMKPWCEKSMQKLLKEK